VICRIELSNVSMAGIAVCGVIKKKPAEGERHEGTILPSSDWVVARVALFAASTSARRKTHSLRSEGCSRVGPRVLFRGTGQASIELASSSSTKDPDVNGYTFEVQYEDRPCNHAAGDAGGHKRLLEQLQAACSAW